jgi:hypothetical protein
MATVDAQNERRITDSLNRLVAFGRNPRDPQAWNEARIALGELGDTAGRLLAGKPQEDASLTSSLTELDGFAENLRNSPANDDARRHFEVSLGDVEYRIKRLFAVSIR